jgi:hypothetical protein
MVADAVAALRIGQDERRHHRQAGFGVSRRFIA